MVASVPKASAFQNEPSMKTKQHYQYDIIVSSSAATEIRDRMEAGSQELTERDQPYAKDRIIVRQMQVPGNPLTEQLPMISFPRLSILSL